MNEKINHPLKPPLGLTPRGIIEERRLFDIIRAIHRYTEACYPIPIDWIEEYNSLIKSRKDATIKHGFDNLTMGTLNELVGIMNEKYNDVSERVRLPNSAAPAPVDLKTQILVPGGCNSTQTGLIRKNKPRPADQKGK